MKAKFLRLGQKIDGRTIVKITLGMSEGRAYRKFNFTDGGQPCELWEDAAVEVSGYVEPLPAGDVPSRPRRVPGKPRYSDGRWAGEVGGFSIRTGGRTVRVGKFNARSVDMTARNRGFDLPGRSERERASGPARLR